MPLATFEELLKKVKLPKPPPVFPTVSASTTPLQTPPALTGGLNVPSGWKLQPDNTLLSPRGLNFKINKFNADGSIADFHVTDAGGKPVTFPKPELIDEQVRKRLKDFEVKRGNITSKVPLAPPPAVSAKVTTPFPGAEQAGKIFEQEQPKLPITSADVTALQPFPSPIPIKDILGPEPGFEKGYRTSEDIQRQLAIPKTLGIPELPRISGEPEPLPEPRQGVGFALDILTGRKTTENPEGLTPIEYSLKTPVGQAGIVGIPTAVTLGAVGYQGLKAATELLLNASIMRNLSLQSQARGVSITKEQAQVFANELTSALSRRFSMGQNWKNIFDFTRGKYVPKPGAAAEAENMAKEAVAQFLIPWGTQTGAVASGGIGRPAQAIKNLPYATETAALKATQEYGERIGLDVEAIAGIAPAEYWVAISAKAGDKTALKDWLKTLPEAAQKEIGMRIGGIDVVTGRIGVKKGMFAPFKNIQDAQKFLQTGDTTLIAKTITQRGKPWTPKELEATRKAAAADVVRREKGLAPLQKQIDEVQAQLSAIEPQRKAEQDMDKWKALGVEQSKLEEKLRALQTQYTQARIRPEPSAPTVAPFKPFRPTRGISEEQAEAKLAALQAKMTPEERAEFQISVRPEVITPAAPIAEAKPPVPAPVKSEAPAKPVEEIPPAEQVKPKPRVAGESETQRVKAIQEQGKKSPESVAPEDAKEAHIEMAAPDGPRPPKPPKAKPTKASEPSDIVQSIADKATPGERPDQTLLRLHEAAISSENRRVNLLVRDGSKKLKEQGIGVWRRGSLVPRTEDIPQLDELYNALHNPSKVASGEILLPKGYEAIYQELRGLTDWEQAARLDFDPDMATIDDYFYRGWKPPEGAFADVQQGRPLVKTPAFKKPRVNATYQEMREAGFEPLFWNPYQQWGLSRMQGTKYREQMELVSYLKGMGDEFIRPHAGGPIPQGWRVPEVGSAFEGKPFATTNPVTDEPVVMFTRRWIVPDRVANTLENIYGKKPNLGKFIIKGKTIDPLAIIDWLTFVPKRAKLIGTFFQQIDFLTRAGAGSWTRFVDALMRGQPIEAIKAPLKYPQSVFKILQANFNPATRQTLARQLDDTTPLIKDRPGINLKGISEAGLSTRDVTIFPADMDKLIRQVANEVGVLGRVKRVAGKVAGIESAMRRGLFDGVYPAAIITDIQNNIAPIIANQHPELNDAQINGLIARVANIKYSTIPASQSVFQNRVVRETLRRAFFSTGESEGLIRQATGAFHGPNAGFWRKHWLGVYLFLILAANIIHFASTREPLPKERYVPIAKNKWGPLPFGYNTQFAAPTLPFGGKAGEELTLDIVGQMDTALRLLDPTFFIQARQSVPVRAVINQASGTNFFGDRIDDVGPGGVVSRTAHLAQDLFLPIGVGGLAVTAGRQFIPGGKEVISKGEETIGFGGLALQATGFNVRAINVKKQVVERARANLGKFDQDELDSKLKQAIDNKVSLVKIAEIKAGNYLYDITSLRRDIGKAIRYLDEEDIAKLDPIAGAYWQFANQKDEYELLSTKEKERYLKGNPEFITNRLFWGDSGLTTIPDLKTAEAVASQAEKYKIPLNLIPAFKLTDKGKERIPSDRNLWKPYFDYYDLPGNGGYLSYSKEQVEAGKLPDKFKAQWETYQKLKTDTAKTAFRKRNKEAATDMRDDFRRANPEFSKWAETLSNMGDGEGLKPLSPKKSVSLGSKSPPIRLATPSGGLSGGSVASGGRSKSYPKFKKMRVRTGLKIRAPRTPRI